MSDTYDSSSAASGGSEPGSAEAIARAAQAADAGWRAGNRADGQRLAAAHQVMVECLAHPDCVADPDRPGRAAVDAGVMAASHLVRMFPVSSFKVESMLSFAADLHFRYPAILAAMLDGDMDESTARALAEQMSHVDESVLADLQQDVVDDYLSAIAAGERPGIKAVRQRADQLISARDRDAVRERMSDAGRDRGVRISRGRDGMSSLYAMLHADEAAVLAETLDATIAATNNTGDTDTTGDTDAGDEAYSLAQRRADALMSLTCGDAAPTSGTTTTAADSAEADAADSDEDTNDFTDSDCASSEAAADASGADTTADSGTDAAANDSTDVDTAAGTTTAGETDTAAASGAGATANDFTDADAAANGSTDSADSTAAGTSAGGAGVVGVSVTVRPKVTVIGGAGGVQGARVEFARTGQAAVAALLEMLATCDGASLECIDPAIGAGDDPEQALRYRPGAALAARVRLRDGTCRHPGCAVPIEDCDLDHVIPFDHADPSSGGLTVEANLMGLCRRHHRFKTFNDWHYQLQPDGTLTITTAEGQQIITRPAGPLAAHRREEQDAEDRAWQRQRRRRPNPADPAARTWWSERQARTSARRAKQRGDNAAARAANAERREKAARQARDVELSKHEPGLGLGFMPIRISTKPDIVDIPAHRHSNWWHANRHRYTNSVSGLEKALHAALGDLLDPPPPF